MSDSPTVKRHIAFGHGDLRNCPNCDTPVSGFVLYEKHEPEMYSLYVLPCNCRLGLWSGAPSWNKEANLPVRIITTEDQKRGYSHQAEVRRIKEWNERVAKFNDAQTRQRKGGGDGR